MTTMVRFISSVSVFSVWRFSMWSHSADAISPEALASGFGCSFGHISSIERATALAVTATNDGWSSCVVSLIMFPIILVIKKSSCVR